VTLSSTWQLEAEKQHAPLGWGQGFGSHAVTPEVQVPAHAACVVTLHPPVAELQQRPWGCGQGLGEQVASCVHAPVQLAWVVTAH
jgi:hypothetical protein